MNLVTIYQVVNMSSAPSSVPNQRDERGELVGGGEIALRKQPLQLGKKGELSLCRR
jgi:hypothetical protein